MEIYLTKQAEKDLDSFDYQREKATQALLTLKENPLEGHPLTGRLSGARALAFNLNDGAYRAAYYIDGNEIYIFIVGPHEGFYNKAKRRWESVR